MAQEKQTSIEKRDKHPISVPFIWEEKPGTPLKDWKPAFRPIKLVEPTIPTPTKLVVSVPFGWEEKPGTPLPYFTKPQNELSQKKHNVACTSDSAHSDQSNQYSDSESDRSSNQTDESFISAPSLMSNESVIHNQQQGYETCSSFNSTYATESRRLAGASFLEWLFPLLATNSSSPDKVQLLETDPTRTDGTKGAEFRPESNRCEVSRPLLTLGELIVMSRRMSCRRKVMSMQKQSSMVRFVYRSVPN